ncbi:MAG: Slp family lipoprotein [Nitrospiraceae bacterium]
MNSCWTGSVIALCLSVSACGPPSLFQPEVMKEVEPDFDFQAWRSASNANVGRHVKLGGRIIQAELTQEGVLIVAAHLPITEHPVYGPRETGKRTGEFVFLYPGQLEDRVLTTGNRLIVVGTTQRARIVSVDDAPKTEPYLIARCVHIWKTEGREIADFPNVGAGYYPLEENTYCLRPAPEDRKPLESDGQGRPVR